MEIWRQLLNTPVLLVLVALKTEDHLKGVLPKEFMQLGISVHQNFDKIAVDAQSIKDPKHTRIKRIYG